METVIIIDENFDGVYEQDGLLWFDTDLNYPNARVEVKIPLLFTGTIICESLHADKLLRVGNTLIVSNSLYVGESLLVGDSLHVGESIEVGEWLRVFGEKTTKYAKMSVNKYPIIFTSSLIKIGHELWGVEDWEDFTDVDIEEMDELTSSWWNVWRELVLTTHENLPEVY
jgi:hypothetical protein